ncbi:hypothetical protein D3C71_1670610 [compost metagenome]
MHRCLNIVPVLFRLEVAVLKLMLHIEQPDACYTGYEEDRQLHEEKCLPAYSPDQQGNHRSNPHVGNIRIYALLWLRVFAIEAVDNQKYIDRTDREHNQRVAIHTVIQPAKWGRRQVLLFGQSPDIAGTPTIKIAVGSMVNRMAVPPLMVRTKGQNPCKCA